LALAAEVLSGPVWPWGWQRPQGRPVRLFFCSGIFAAAIRSGLYAAVFR